MRALPAFKNDPELKAEAVHRAKAHRDAGRIVQGTFGQWKIQEPGTAEFRGCAIGCLAQPLNRVTVHNWTMAEDDGDLVEFIEREPGVAERADEPDAALKRKFNIGLKLGSLIDRLFEASTPRAAKDWPLQIMEAIPVGRDVSDRAIQELIEAYPVLDSAMDLYGGFADWADEGSRHRAAGQARRVLIQALQA